MSGRKPSKVIVTGGSGFIGSHLVDYLLGQDIDVVVFDNFSSGVETNLMFARNSKQLCVVKMDLTKDKLNSRFFENVDIVYHLAASVGVKYATRYPSTVLINNLMGISRLFKRCIRSGVKRLVFASSSEVYGNSEQSPVSEDLPLSPISSYGMSKMTGESLCKASYDEFGLQTCIIRYFNVYGPRQDTRTRSWVVPNFICNALLNKPIMIHGRGTQTRDFTYVADAIKGTYLVSTRGIGNADAYNIGTGQETSMNELAVLVKEITAKEVPTRHTRDRKFQISRRCADIGKARKKFGYLPEIGLRTGLKYSKQYYEGVLSE